MGGEIVDKLTIEENDIKFPDSSEKIKSFEEEDHHDSEDIFSSSPEASTSLVNTNASQHIETDIEDLFASSPPKDSTLSTSPSRNKKAKIATQKSTATKRK